MAEFYEKTSDYPGVGTRIGPGVETEGDDGMAAFGKPVPWFRRDAALQAWRSMGGTATDKAVYHLNRAAQQIERDEPYQAMQELAFICDMTGVYRLLATLCVAEVRPSNQPPIEAVDWDAVAKREVEGSA